MFVLATSSVILLTLTHLVNSDLNYKTLHFQIILGNFEHLPSSYGSKCNFIFQFCQYNYYSPKNSFAPFCTRQEKTIKKKNSTLWLDDRKRLNTLLLYNVTLTFYGVLSVWEYNHHWFAWRMAVAQMALLLEFSVPSIGFELRLCGSGSFFRFPWFNYLS